MSHLGQSRRSSYLGMSASPPTPDVWLRRSEPTLRANSDRSRYELELTLRAPKRPEAISFGTALHGNTRLAHALDTVLEMIRIPKR